MRRGQWNYGRVHDDPYDSYSAQKVRRFVSERERIEMPTYSDVTVVQANIFRGTCAVVFRHQGIKCSERFRSREDAEMWAQKLREGHWDPLD